MERLYITGGAGSGKTTLAKLISERCDLPHFEVDGGEAGAPRRRRTPTASN